MFFLFVYLDASVKLSVYLLHFKLYVDSVICKDWGFTVFLFFFLGMVNGDIIQLGFGKWSENWVLMLERQCSDSVFVVVCAKKKSPTFSTWTKNNEKKNYKYLLLPRLRNQICINCMWKPTSPTLSLLCGAIFPQPTSYTLPHSSPHWRELHKAAACESNKAFPLLSSFQCNLHRGDRQCPLGLHGCVEGGHYLQYWLTGGAQWCFFRIGEHSGVAFESTMLLSVSKVQKIAVKQK